MSSREDLLNVIAKPNGLKEGAILFVGLSNHCCQGKYFHTFLDCDTVRLNNLTYVLDRKEYSSMGDWFIIQSSPHHFSLVNFAMINWERYVEILEDFPWVHDGYSFRVQQKKYAVLRTGGKYGITPKVVYQISNTAIGHKTCLNCTQVFMEEVKRWDKWVSLS